MKRFKLWRLRRYIDTHDTSQLLATATWDDTVREPKPTYVINVRGGVDPVETGKQVETILRNLRRGNGGRPLGLD